MWTAEKAWAGPDNSVILTPRYKDSLEGNKLSPRPKLVTCVLIRMREEVGDKEANLKKKSRKITRAWSVLRIGWSLGGKEG